MSPEAFVELLARELQVAGVVVGSNYRFGYRAAGTADLLQRLGPQHGMRVRVLELVAQQAVAAAAADRGTAPAGAQQQQQQQHTAQDTQLSALQPQQQQHSEQQRAVDRRVAHEAVSSSRVRHALSHGDMAAAALYLDRPYRLVASLAEEPASSALADGVALRLPSAALLNQAPAPGQYTVAAALTGADTLQQLGPTRRAVLGIDEAGISLHGGADLLEALPPGAEHLTLDFLCDAAGARSAL